MLGSVAMAISSGIRAGIGCSWATREVHYIRFRWFGLQGCKRGGPGPHWPDLDLALAADQANAPHKQGVIWAPSLQAVLAHLVDPFCIVIAWPSRCIPCPTEEQQGANHQQHLHNREPRSGAITIIFNASSIQIPAATNSRISSAVMPSCLIPYQHLQRIPNPNHHVTLQNYQAAPFRVKHCIHIQFRKRTMPPRTSAPPTILPRRVSGGISAGR